MSGALHDPSRQCETEYEFYDLMVGDRLLTGSVQVTYNVTPTYRDAGDPPRMVAAQFEIIALDQVRVDWIVPDLSSGDEVEGPGFLPWRDPLEAAVVEVLRATSDLKDAVVAQHRED
ncbi:hypothetical protein MKK64_05255 [Methylobacterium sp. E-025]|jgi:hypothetical protein|uniref:hypothetical protein n=1 Tax=unclassified Methylobacterium TaxID=2615210 RepID=UPI001FBB5242|nr:MULTISPECIES: hypothetical protein [unclassified Methylobacterium]MCJ2039879.1 hypothetical protein [Methylobacterium sp. J-059]MCJ2110612.1 hypothetical protein [Methylobacterium sp. E-025]